MVGKDGPVPFLSLFEGRVELLVYQHMWWDGAPHQGQCEGRALTAWHLQDATSLRTAGVSFAVLTTGEKEEAEPFLAFMGCTEPRHSERRTPHPIGGDMGHPQCYVREGERVFLTYNLTGGARRSALPCSVCWTSPPSAGARPGRRCRPAASLSGIH